MTEVVQLQELMTEPDPLASTVPATAPEARLHRGIQGWHVTLIALGGIIGSCYFLGSGYTIREVGPSIVLSYLLGGLVIFAVMQSFGELLVNVPRSGSFVTHCKSFLGDVFSCGAGWSYWMSWVVYVPSEAVAAGIIVHNLINFHVLATSIIALGLITLMNVFHVAWFGHVESVLAVLKILAIAVFSVCAVLILTGAIGGHAVGFSVIYDPNVGVYKSLFPEGVLSMFTTMVMILVNFQGSEIVGLAASETQNPEVNIPKACRSVAYRIILIYAIPMILLVMILPYKDAGLEDSVFALALKHYGLRWAQAFFDIIVIVSAFSCANSGVYGTVRTLYGLSSEGLAPAIFLRLNRFNVPQIATIVTIVPMWGFIFLSYYLGEGKFYKMMLAMSGFTGSICWGGILGAQLMMRYQLWRRGYVADEVLQARVVWNPVLPMIALAVIIVGLGLMAAKPDLLYSFIYSVAWTIGPMTAFWIVAKCGKAPPARALACDEVDFDERYPSRVRVSKDALLPGSEGTAPENKYTSVSLRNGMMGCEGPVARAVSRDGSSLAASPSLAESCDIR
jgi:AAT family amino acid transporter